MAAQKTAPKTNTPQKTYSVSAIAVLRAANTGSDPSRAAKEVRSRLRANFAKVLEIQPDVAKVKTAANDGNRWPLLTDDVVNALNLTTGRKVATDD